MDIHHVFWNRQQQLLKRALSRPEGHPEWLDLFLQQHAQVHTSKLSAKESWSFEDEVLHGLRDDSFRRIPKGGEHSIAWILFHLARIEDVTMNMLLADTDQLIEQANWLERMRVHIRDTGNAMTMNEVTELSQEIDVDTLLKYRLAVGTRTCQLVSQVESAELTRSVDPIRIEKVRSSGAVVEKAKEILEYWSRRTIAGLLLMPPTRHCFLHMNEALRIKQDIIES